MGPLAVQQHHLEFDAVTGEGPLCGPRNVAGAGAHLQDRQMRAATFARDAAQQVGSSAGPAEPIINVPQVNQRTADLGRSSEVVIEQLGNHFALHEAVPSANYKLYNGETDAVSKIYGFSPALAISLAEDRAGPACQRRSL